jgi:hypothetical protein
MTIHWKALEEHFHIVPLPFQFNHIRETHFLNISLKPQCYVRPDLCLATSWLHDLIYAILQSIAINNNGNLAQDKLISWSRIFLNIMNHIFFHKQWFLRSHDSIKTIHYAM